MFLCCRKVKWVAKLWLMMGVSGVYRGLYDRLWEFLPTSDYEHCSKWLWKFLGFCHVFFELMFEGLCYWVGWRLEAWTREDEVWGSIVFFYPGAGGVERVPWTFGPQFSLCEIRHFWIFFQHLWRVNAGNKSAKMVIGPTSMFGLFQSCGGSNAMEDLWEGLAKLRCVSDCVWKLRENPEIHPFIAVETN